MNKSPVRVIDMPATQSKISCGRSFIYQRIKEGTFPQPIKLGARRIGFLESEIDDWIEARTSASRINEKEAAQ